MVKKIIFCLALLAPTTYLLSANKEEVPTLTSQEQSALNNLYLVDEHIPSFEKTTDLDFDYHLALLEKHRQILQHEIRSNKSGWSVKSSEIAFVVAVAALSTAGFGYIIHHLWQNLSTGKFGNVNIHYDLLKTLSSLKYSRSERKKLDRVSVDKITITYEQPWEETLARMRANCLSPSERQNLAYFTRSEAIRNAQTGIGAIAACWAFLTAWILGPTMYGTIYYADNLAKELERDKILHQRLLTEKMNRLTAYMSAA